MQVKAELLQFFHLLVANRNKKKKKKALQHTALHAACLGGSASVVKALVSAKANVNSRAKNGCKKIDKNE
jgi:ankyrin repeat protein